MSAAPTPKTFIRKAEGAVAGARLLLQAGDTDGATSRAYYAMFDAAHAALFALGVEGLVTPIKTHNGLIARFGREVVLPGHVSSTYGGDLNKVQELRAIADYSGSPVEPDKAAWALERAEAFVAQIKTVFLPYV